MSQQRLQQIKQFLNRRTLRGLMALYEQNYSNVCRLIPGLHECQGAYVCHPRQGPDLYLLIEEQSPFTTTLRLSYLFEQDGDVLLDPDLQIRAYHDARQAETLACRPQGYRALRTPNGSHKPVMDCKWDSNLFLDKWLSYTLVQGYDFAKAKAVTWPQPQTTSLLVAE